VLTREALKRLAEQALAMAKLAPPDPFAGVAEATELATQFPDLDLVSAALPNSDQLLGMARDVEDAARAVTGVAKSGGSSASASRREVALAISNGFAQRYERTGVALSVSAIAGEGTAMQRDYDYSYATHWSDLRSAAEVGREAGERAVKRLSPRKLKSQALSVIYDRRVASGLVGHLLGAINGAAIARGTSFLKDALETAVFSDAITIVEDPFVKRGLGSRPFDSEGLSGDKRNIIDRGLLTGWLLDLRSARQLKLKPQGQASRGLASPPSPTTSNVHLEAGAISVAGLMAEAKHGLLVTELMGSSINMVTGDYSRGASGFYFENGEIAYPASEITIAGNLKDMFKRITPASDLEFRGSVNAPSLLVEGMTLAGL
jgi:PmbA protein